MKQCTDDRGKTASVRFRLSEHRNRAGTSLTQFHSQNGAAIAVANHLLYGVFGDVMFRKDSTVNSLNCLFFIELFAFRRRPVVSCRHGFWRTISPPI